MAIKKLYNPQLYLILENKVTLLHLFHRASFQKTLPQIELEGTAYMHKGAYG